MWIASGVATPELGEGLEEDKLAFPTDLGVFNA